MMTHQKLSTQTTQNFSSIENNSDDFWQRVEFLCRPMTEEELEKCGKLENESFIWEVLYFSKDKEAAVSHWNATMKQVGFVNPETKDYLCDKRWIDWIQHIDPRNFLDVLSQVRAALPEFCKRMPVDQANLILTLDKFKNFQFTRESLRVFRKIRQLQKSITHSYLSKFIYTFPIFFQKIVKLSKKYNWRSLSLFFLVRGISVNDEEYLVIPIAWIYNRATDHNRAYIQSALDKILEEMKS